MTTNQYISVRETAQILSISERKVMDLIENGELQAYRIANKFLRLKKTDVLDLRNSGNITQENIQFSYTVSEKVKDFLYYNDFYIVSFCIVIGLLYVIFYM